MIEYKTLLALNQRLMVKQLLSEKSSNSESTAAVAEACCGINSQDYLESLSSFWARSQNFRNSDFLNQMKPHGGIVRTWTVRGTMHTIPSKDYYVYVFGSGRNSILSGYDRWAKRLGIPSKDFRIEKLYQPLMDQIKGESVTTDRIKQFMINKLTQLGLVGRMTLRRGWSSLPTEGPTWVGITEMSYLGMLVSAGRKGSQSLWMRASDWLSNKNNELQDDECITELIRKYIQQYGPVTRSDIGYWCNRISKNELDNSLALLKKDLTVEHFDGLKEAYYSFNEDASDYPEAPKTIILPEFDSLMMGYKDRSRFHSLDYLKNVSKPQGIISRTILLNGFVSATWGKKKQKDKLIVTVTPFRELDSTEKRSIMEKFLEYSDYLGTLIQVEF